MAGMAVRRTLVGAEMVREFCERWEAARFVHSEILGAVHTTTARYKNPVQVGT